MSTIRTSVFSRFNQFRENFRKVDTYSKNALNFSFWFISLLAMAIGWNWAGYNINLILLIIHLVFLVKLVKNIQKFGPPVELLLLLNLVLFILSKWLLNAAHSSGQVGSSPGVVLTFIHIVILGFQALVLSLILSGYDTEKKPGIAWIFLLGFIGHYIFLGDNDYLLFFYQLLLLVTLIHRTRWLEELTKTDCWLYLLVIFLMFELVYNLNPFTLVTAREFARPLLWFSLPYYLYLLFKLYLLAVLIKIPTVLIYHHARLSRKLKISGLFQSTFPQFMQLIILLLIFYIFISGWQAGNLQNSIQIQLENIKQHTNIHSIRYYKILANANKIGLVGYEPQVEYEQLPEKGVLRLSQNEPDNAADTYIIDYFIFFKSTTADSNFLYLVQVDSAFLTAVSEKLRFIAGTSLAVTIVRPTMWSLKVYKNFFWPGDRYLRVFPCAIIPAEGHPDLSVQLAQQQNSQGSVRLPSFFKFIIRQQFVFGRIFLPVVEFATPSPDYLVFDIVLDLGHISLWSGMTRIILVLILIYLLFNSFVIRRVVRFGEHINQIIVHKFGQLKSGINEIAAGNLDYKIKLEGEDEFVELAGRFNQMGDRLQQTIAEAREKDRLQYELQIARKVQLSLLPPRIPIVPGYHISASLETATEVGGDFYDIIPLENNRYLITIGDVSGKGSSAALYMAQCLSLIRFSRQFTTDPGEICSRLNDYFATSIMDRQIYVTVIIGVMDVNLNTLIFVRAGHPEPVFIPGNSNQKIQMLPAGGLGIGLTKTSLVFEQALKPNRVSFNSGDTIIFYTDGVIEATRQYNENFLDGRVNFATYGEERLVRVLKNLRGQNAVVILQELEHDIELFYAGQARVDDHTIFIIQRSASDREK